MVLLKVSVPIFLLLILHVIFLRTINFIQDCITVHFNLLLIEKSTWSLIGYDFYLVPPLHDSCRFGLQAATGGSGGGGGAASESIVCL